MHADPEQFRFVLAALVAAVAWGAVPCAHMLLHCGTSGECRTLLLDALARVFGLYGLGFAIFFSRLPERLAPGSFDIVGHSHQLWHVCVVAAGYSWYRGMMDLHGLRAAHGKEWCEVIVGPDVVAASLWTTRGIFSS